MHIVVVAGCGPAQDLSLRPTGSGAQLFWGAVPGYFCFAQVLPFVEAFAR